MISNKGARQRFIGSGLIGLGTLVALIGLFKSGAPELSDTLNIGLLNDKTNLILFGGFTAMCGSVFAAVGQLARILDRP